MNKFMVPAIAIALALNCAAAFARYIQGDPAGIVPNPTPRAITSADVLRRQQLNHSYAYVNSSPLRYVDPTGLDYWIEGSVPGEGGHPFHQSICVGQYAGARACISFGVAEDNCLMGCRGEVYQDTSAAGPIVRGTHRVTSSEIDMEILRYFSSMMGRSGRYYLIGNSCRDFSRDVHRTLDSQYYPSRGNPFGGSILFR